MSDWQDALNLMRVEKKKTRSKKKDKSQIGLRCWECGQYLDSLNAGHYCTQCLIKHLKKFGFVQSQTKVENEVPDRKSKSS